MLAQSHESDRTTKKMEVVFEEVLGGCQRSR